MTEEDTVSSPSPTTASSPDNKVVERKVTIVGTASAQCQAQYFVFQKVYTELYNQASTSLSASPPLGPYGDPMVLKVEILVPTNQVRRIIGKNGTTIQELQRSSGATIKLHKETQPCTAPSSVSTTVSTSSANGTSDADKPGDKTISASASLTSTVTDSEMTAVHIIGEFQSSFAAQRQIRLIVLRSTNVPSSSHQSSLPQQHAQSQQLQTKSAKTTGVTKSIETSDSKAKPATATSESLSVATSNTATAVSTPESKSDSVDNVKTCEPTPTTNS